MNGPVSQLQADIMIFFLSGIWTALLIILVKIGRK